MTEGTEASKRAKRKWNGRNAERLRAWRLANMDRLRLEKKKWKLMSKYGITVEHYEVLVKEHGGKCAVCKEVPRGRGVNDRLHLDHCHATGRIRGMLCNRCNMALGLGRDSVDLLGKMIAYLKKYGTA